MVRSAKSRQTSGQSGGAGRLSRNLGHRNTSTESRRESRFQMGYQLSVNLRSSVSGVTAAVRWRNRQASGALVSN